MVHTVVIGQTLSGKTKLTQRILHAKRGKTERPILVLDPCLDPDWQADFITDDREKFLEMVKNNSGCDLAVDESGETIGRYAKEMGFLATRSRHYGHTCTFIAQRAEQIDKNVRTQCTTLILFSVDIDDAETMSRVFVEPELKNAYLLSQGECYIKERYKPVQKIKTFTVA